MSFNTSVYRPNISNIMTFPRDNKPSQSNQEHSKWTMMAAEESNAAELSDVLEIWLKSSTADEAAAFIKAVEECYNPQDSMFNDLVSTSAVDQSFDYEEDQKLQVTQAVVEYPSMLGQNSAEQFLTSGTELDPAFEQSQYYSTSFSDNIYLQPISPSNSVEEMFTSVGGGCEYLPINSLEVGVKEEEEELLGQTHGMTSPVQGLSLAQQQWQRNGLQYAGPPAAVHCRTDSYEMSEHEDESSVYDEDRLSNSPGSVRINGGRRYSSLEKRERRREQNRRAAEKCRNRKKVAFQSFREECERVKVENLKYRAQIQGLRQHVNQLNAKLEFHRRTCLIGRATPEY